MKDRMTVTQFKAQFGDQTWKVDDKKRKTGKHGKGGKRADLDARYFRSAMEANIYRYALFLLRHKQIKSVEYEKTEYEFPIRRGVRFYKPDLDIVNLDDSFEHWEVKGWNDPKSKTQLKRMAKYYPKVKVVFIGTREYRDIQRRVSKLIPGWE